MINTFWHFLILFLAFLCLESVQFKCEPFTKIRIESASKVSLLETSAGTGCTAASMAEHKWCLFSVLPKSVLPFFRVANNWLVFSCFRHHVFEERLCPSGWLSRAQLLNVTMWHAEHISGMACYASCVFGEVGYGLWCFAQCLYVLVPW